METPSAWPTRPSPPSAAPPAAPWAASSTSRTAGAGAPAWPPCRRSWAGTWTGSSPTGRTWAASTGRSPPSALYAALALGPDRWETGQAVLDDYRVLVDLLYFECSSARITRFTEHRVEERCRGLLPSGRGGAGPLSLAVGYDQRPLEGEDAPFTMEDVVRFAREADRLVALQPGTTSAAAILSGVLCNSRAVALGTSGRDLSYLTRLAYRVDDPDRAASQDLLQEASDAGSFLTLERRA